MVNVTRALPHAVKLRRYLPAKIKYLTIHCTATPEGRDNTAAEVVHMDMEKYHQPSYQIIVELDGDSVRCLDDCELGAHVGLHNTGNIGISYVGGTECLNKGGKPKDTRTDAQKATLRRLVAEYKKLYPGIIVRGHRDWPKVAKACPCFDVATQL
jgi:N-acetylmuramoyl-L-alanine amidase